MIFRTVGIAWSCIVVDTCEELESWVPSKTNQSSARLATSRPDSAGLKFYNYCKCDFDVCLFAFVCVRVCVCVHCSAFSLQSAGSTNVSFEHDIQQPMLSSLATLLADIVSVVQQLLHCTFIDGRVRVVFVVIIIITIIIIIIVVVVILIVIYIASSLSYSLPFTVLQKSWCFVSIGSFSLSVSWSSFILVVCAGNSCCWVCYSFFLPSPNIIIKHFIDERGILQETLSYLCVHVLVHSGFGK